MNYANVLLTVICLPLIALFPSCREQEQNLQVHEFYLLDRTVDQDTTTIREMIVKRAGQAVGTSPDSLGGYFVYVAGLSASRYPHPCREHLQAQAEGMGHYPQKRKEQVRAKLKRISKLTACAYADSISTEFTYLFQPLVDAATEMAEDTVSSMKRILVLSDGMAHNVEFSLYRYLNNPKAMDEDRGKLLDEIDRIYAPIPEMNDVTVIFYPIASEHEQVTCQAAQRLFKAWVERHGGTFKRAMLDAK